MPEPRQSAFSLANLRDGGSVYLLVALLLMFLLIPLLQAMEPLEWLLPGEDDRVGRVLLRIASSAVLITAAVTVAQSSHPKRLIAILIAFPLAVDLPQQLGVSMPSVLDAAAETYTGFALLYVVYRGVAALFTRRTVTADMISIALCAYLLLGLAWHYFYQAVWIANPGSAFDGLSEVTTKELRATELFYFSFVTLTTVGYGGITPTGNVTRSLAVLEAVIGQMFVAVVLARLVGLQVASATQVAIEEQFEEEDSARSKTETEGENRL